MKSSKHGEHKPAQSPRNPGRDFHSARDKEVRTVKEDAKPHKDKGGK
jgi:hypothetical protein